MNQLKIDQYAVFGNPIEHSKSPQIHRAFAAQTGQAIHYDRQSVPLDAFKLTADQFFANGGKGLNITVPFKLDAYDYAEKLTERAQQAGAVNTLITKDQLVIGDNTDGVGLLTDIRSLLGWRIKNSRVLIMGAGGAVRGILAPLLHEQPACLVIVNRNKDKARKLVQLFSHLADENVCDYCNYKELHQELLHTHKMAFDIIINGTSASLSSKLPPISEKAIHSGSQCYDMVYGAELTAFLQWSQQRGAAVLSDGLGMLVCQAAESFYQWRGIRPHVEKVIEQLRASTATNQ